MDAILAIDLGTKAGWRLRRADGKYAGGSLDFSGSSKRIGQRYFYFRRFLWRAAKNVEPDGLEAVIYEKVQFMPNKRGGLMAAQAWAGFEAVLTSWCEHMEIRYLMVPVGTLKKHFTGNGHATKDDMLHRARALGFRPKDDNEADAIALMEFWEAEHEGRPRRVAGHEKVRVQEQELPL